jgi:hypothetical protein
LTVSISLAVSLSAEYSFSISLSPSYSQLALSTLVESAIWIEATTHVTTMVEANDSETLITQIPTVTQMASTTEVWTVTWVELIVYAEASVQVVKTIWAFEVPLFVTSIKGMQIRLGSDTEAPRAALSNAVIIGSATGSAACVAVLVGIVVWFVRTARHSTSGALVTDAGDKADRRSHTPCGDQSADVPSDDLRDELLAV